MLGGVLYFAAFPGVDVWPLAFVAFVPVRLALYGQAPRRATLLGALFGFAVTMTGFSWLLDMLKTFSGFPTLACLGLMVLLNAYQGGRLALMGWLSARGVQRGWPEPLVFALAFAASEFLFPLLFPWYFGATVHQVPWLTQTAELGGPILVGLVLLAGNLALSEPLLARLTRQRLSRLRLAGFAAVPLVAAAYGALRLPSVDAAVAAAPKARVGLVQGNMSLIAKRVDRNEGLRRHLRLSAELRREGPLDLVVWSETSVAGALGEQEAAEFYKENVGAPLGVPAIFGGVLVEDVPDERGYVLYNSALATDATGTLQGRYDKQFLLAFGEYLPFGNVFPKLYEWSPNSGRFTPGPRKQLVELDGHGIAVMICYEDILPGFASRLVRPAETALLVNISNDAWFGDTREPWIHLALAKFRAIEHRRFLVRSTNSGVSAFVDPAGRVTGHTKTFEQAALVREVAWLTPAPTVYERLGDAPWWLVSAASVTLAFLRGRSRRPPT